MCANCHLYMCHNCGINFDCGEFTTSDEDKEMKKHHTVCKKAQSFDVCFTLGGEEGYIKDEDDSFPPP